MAPPWQNKERYDIKKKMFFLCSILLCHPRAVAPVKFLGLFPQLCGHSAQGHHGHLPGREGLQGLGDLESSYKSPLFLHCTAQLV